MSSKVVTVDPIMRRKVRRGKIVVKLSQLSSSQLILDSVLTRRFLNFWAWKIGRMERAVGSCFHLHSGIEFVFLGNCAVGSPSFFLATRIPGYDIRTYLNGASA